MSPKSSSSMIAMAVSRMASRLLLSDAEERKGGGGGAMMADTDGRLALIALVSDEIDWL